MFFNENFYLEDATDAPEMTDGEVQEAQQADDGGQAAAAAQAGDSAPAEKLQDECCNMYAESLEWQLGANEYFSNLKEKMMNVEHVAGLKKARGLYSESAMLLESGASEFLEKVKVFFKKIWNAIVKMFNKFVNFISSLTVTANAIIKANESDAWKSYKARVKEDINVKCFNMASADAFQFANEAQKIENSLSTEINNIVTKYSAALSVVRTDGSNNKIYEGLKAKINFKDEKVKELIGAMAAEALDDGGNSATSNEHRVLVKQPQKLTESLFKDRKKYVGLHKQVLGMVKASKQASKKVVDNGIKSIKDFEKTVKNNNDNYERPKGMSPAIQGIKQCGSICQTVFSKLISIESQYYRESLAICRRVIGAARVNNAFKEGFDMAAYFNA